MSQSTIGLPAVTPDVVAQAIPFATQVPKSEGGTAQMGSAPRVPREDHQHPRLTATAKGVLDTNGLKDVTFTQAYDTEPAVSIISVGARAAGWAVPDFDFTFAQDVNGKYVGGTVYGRRARKLPTQPLAGNPLTGALIVLTSIASGLNAMAASITGYDATEPAAGAGFTLIAVKQS